MLKRTLVFSNAMDLSLKFNQIVIAYRELPTETVTVPIEDVGVVVLENQMTVEAKIRNQSLLLDKVHGNGGILKPYYSNVKSGDTDNREGGR